MLMLAYFLAWMSLNGQLQELSKHSFWQQGKKITKQVDHTMWVESLLFHNLPPAVDKFFNEFWRPTTGVVCVCHCHLKHALVGLMRALPSIHRQ